MHTTSTLNYTSQPPQNFRTNFNCLKCLLKQGFPRSPRFFYFLRTPKIVHAAGRTIAKLATELVMYLLFLCLFALNICIAGKSTRSVQPKVTKVNSTYCVTGNKTHNQMCNDNDTNCGTWKAR